ncbi:tyrosine-type recombinase/integrase [Paraburkholderia sediminicola]|uniref:tyrosine-type recombinase/integrase n=1 Tax=Paraburkholderia sediminicola TaxID=458836 RepID=UPI0038BA708F
MTTKHQRHRIDRAFLRAIVPTGKYQEFVDDELRGFGVKVTPTGSIAFCYRWQRPDGTQGRKVIAKWPQTQPGEARELCRKEAALLDHRADGLATLAERKRARTRAQRTVGTMTLATFLTDRYDDHLRAHTKTGTRNADMIRAAFADLLARDLTAVTAWDVEKWRSERLKAGNKPATCNRNINSLRGAFSRAVEWGLLDANPLKPVKKQREPDPAGDRYLTPDEEARLRAALDAREQRLREEQAIIRRGRRRRVGDVEHAFADAVKPAVLLAMNLATRRGELLSLEWRNVDPDHARVTFIDTSTKGSKTRVLALNREALDVLVKWKTQASSEVFVFPNEDGTGPLRDVRGWAEVRDAAKIMRIRLRYHDLRHHAASMLVMGGVDLYSVSRVLGHADTKMTARYSHLSPDHMRNVMAVLDVPNVAAAPAVLPLEQAA